MSDHLPVFINKKNERQGKSVETIYERSYAVYYKIEFQNDVERHDVWNIYWNTGTKDVELFWDYILYAITETVNLQCPLKRMKVCKNSPLWKSLKKKT